MIPEKPMGYRPSGNDLAWQFFYRFWHRRKGYENREQDTGTWPFAAEAIFSRSVYTVRRLKHAYIRGRYLAGRGVKYSGKVGGERDIEYGQEAAAVYNEYAAALKA